MRSNGKGGTVRPLTSESRPAAAGGPARPLLREGVGGDDCGHRRASYRLSPQSGPHGDGDCRST